MINFVFWALLLIVIVCDISTIVGLITISDKSIVKLTEKRMENTINRKVKLYITISLFNEKDAIEDTINFFSKFLGPDIKLVLITTEKEKRLFGENRTAIEISRILNTYENTSNYRVINFPNEVGNKGTQLNYMLSEMRDELDNENSYIMVYDCDSRPDNDTIKELMKLLCSNDLKVVQQSTIYTENYNEVSPYMRVEAIFETIRALGIERKNYFLSCFPGYSRIFQPYAYCVGHGMCFNCKYLYSIDCFPEPNEDVPMGMKLMLLGQAITPMASKDHGKVVNNVRMLFFQSGNWIKAPFHFSKIMSQIDKAKKISLYKKVLFTINTFLDILSWIQYSMLMILSLILFAFGKFTFGIIGLTVLSVSPVFQLLLCSMQNKIIITWKEIILSPFRNIFRGTALISAIYQKIKTSYNEMGR